MTIPAGPSAKVRDIRDSLDHPVIDADAHIIEYLPDLRDRIRDIGGTDVLRRFERHYWTMDHSPRVPAAVRRRFGISHPPWWTYHARNSLDRATATFPRLLAERLPELGIDFAVIYPSYFIQFPSAGDEDFRRAGCRAVNQYMAETFRGLESQMVPIAAIPMHTPEEALYELSYAVGELGHRAVVMQGVIQRSADGTDRQWLDALGIDSAYDYGEVWQFCADHGIAPTFHSSGMAWGSRASLTNFMHNHIGHFAAAGDATARSLLFAGVPVRHPKLRFAFLEGGVGWAGALFAQFSSNFEKRNAKAITHYDPRELDVPLIRSLLDRHGTPAMRKHADELERALLPLSTPVDPIPDEFAASGFGSAEEIREVFERSMFFGCEGDDPMNAVATAQFGSQLGCRLNAIYGSDIGHWDVRDIRDVLPEVYELVERGAFTPEDLRHMLFEAPARLWSDNNPQFFDGTAVASAVNEFNAARQGSAVK